MSKGYGGYDGGEGHVNPPVSTRTNRFAELGSKHQAGHNTHPGKRSQDSFENTTPAPAQMSN